MLSPEKNAQLTALLASLPEPVARQLAEAVEADRLAGGKLLPHDVILDALQPTLRKPARRASLDELDAHTIAIRTARHPDFDPERLAAHLGEFARLADSLTREVDPSRERLMLDRNVVSGAMEDLMERAPREILAALPVYEVGFFGGGPVAPEISRPADGPKTERGLRYARLLVACRELASATSFCAAHKDAFDEASHHLKAYSDAIVREVRAGEGARQTIAAQYLAIAADFTAILFSREEAESLRRRGRTAAADAA